MKIAYVYDNIYPYYIGGVEKRVWELARRLVQRGHEVTLFGMKYWDGKDIIEKEGVRLWGVCPRQDLFINGRRSIKEAIYFAFRVLPPLLKERFDIIDCQHSPYFPSFSARLASLKKNSHLIITWHEVWDNYWFEYLGKKGIFGKAVEKLTAHLTGRIITNSESTKRDLEKIGIRKNIKVIPTGVDFEGIRKISFLKGNSDIIFAGRLIKEKNVALLVRAINLVKDEFQNIHCVIIGDGPEKSNLERLINDLRLGDSVYLKGFVEDDNQLFSYMKASKVFVLPSVREGFGLVVLEANACGLPVITVNHPRNAACDLIKEGENGFICELAVEDIAEKIEIALISKQALENKCIEYAEKFDWDRIVDLIEESYKAAISH